jgi:hypothetical protein
MMIRGGALVAVLAVSLLAAPLAAAAQQTFSGSCQAIFS